MSTDFTKRLPCKRAAAGVIITDQAGRIVLVEPNYKPYWDLPGGHVEAGESPWAAAQREVKEELGIVLEPGRLLVVDYFPASERATEALMFVFDGGEMPVNTALQLDTSELLSWAWCTEPEMRERTGHAPLLARRIATAWEALYDNRTVYLEAGYEVGR